MRFFSLHYLLPFIIAGLSILHIILLHEKGSRNPLKTHRLNQKGANPFSPLYL